MHSLEPGLRFSGENKLVESRGWNDHCDPVDAKVVMLTPIHTMEVPNALYVVNPRQNKDFLTIDSIEMHQKRLVLSQEEVKEEP